AIGARQVPAITAEKDSDVNLVFLALEPAEEAAHPVETVASFDDELFLVVGEFSPGHVEPQLALFRRAVKFRELRWIGRLAPGLDRIVRDRLRGSGDDEIHVELDDVPESMARRAGAKRVVEREQPRLRRFVRDAALTALEPLREPVNRG